MIEAQEVVHGHFHAQRLGKLAKWKKNILSLRGTEREICKWENILRLHHALSFITTQFLFIKNHSRIRGQCPGAIWATFGGLFTEYFSATAP
jgi:hypothetical protein